jgi:acylphosphatase
LSTKTVLARIHGKVQGVWYRRWTVDQATARGLAGWVRNRSDGTVEAVFHGPAEVVDAMLLACQDGPPAARVERVEVERSAESAHDGFHQRATY